MWRDSINQRKKEMGVSDKWIAEHSHVPLRTVTRITSGESPRDICVQHTRHFRRAGPVYG